MLHCQHHYYHTLSPQNLPLYLNPRTPCVRFTSFCEPTSLFSLSAVPPPNSHLWLSELPDLPSITPPDDGGPEQLPFFSSPSIFATTNDPSPLQVTTSVLLTGAIGVFLFRSLRRRARRAKELKFRSSGAKKTLKEEALETLKAIGSAPIETEKKSPSPVQAFLGGISAAVIALILYKFTLTIEASLNRQTISDNFSVRQITITIRTIINGICYLATFVFGLNSVGLFLYSGQLALNSFMEDSTDAESEGKGNEQSDLQNSVSENPADSSQRDQSTDDSQ
ncbi:uncharacterized protein [Euphorbia lathyris]|uniref:uncharacterized protein n=1 Tax=Euphorbia lathyris TaxID=212925 RepID=UPI003313CA8D